jgi:hypothetical protein
MLSGRKQGRIAAARPATVAVVATRPETVIADYARLLALAGITGAGNAASARAWNLVLAAAPGRADGPAAACPPWQLEGVVSALVAAGTAPEALGISVPGHLPPDRRPLAGWRRVLAAHGADPASADSTERPGDSSLLLLANLRTDDRLGLAGAVAAHAAVSLDEREHDELPREREALERAWRRDRDRLVGAVLDATVVGDGSPPGALVPVATHLLVAGRDPVAVDAVASRLLGLDPRRAPLLATLARAGLGRLDPGDIDLVGDTATLPEHLGLTATRRFRGGRRSTGPRWWRRWLAAARERWPRALARRRARRRYASQPWGRLHADYERRGSIAGGDA